jgi:hypothetical protein
MPIIPRGTDDILIDNMVTSLEAFATEQFTIDPDVWFRVIRDMVRPPAMRDMPLVNIWGESVDPQSQGSSARMVTQDMCRINVDCYARGIDDNDDGDDDTKAMARLYYLRDQVRYGLYRLVNADFDMGTGIIGRKKWPRWSLFTTDLKLPESEVVAGRWVIEVECAWQAPDITSVDLEQITVDAGRWAGIYDYT